jgi:ADP-dependent phosphofructokinase/glucokinase
VKHLLVAPQPTYRSEFLPRIWEAIDRGDRDAVPRHEKEIADAFDRAAAILREASVRLGGDAGR